jgi:hypothetical protein
VLKLDFRSVLKVKVKGITDVSGSRVSTDIDSGILAISPSRVSGSELLRVANRFSDRISIELTAARPTIWYHGTGAQGPDAFK